MTRAVDDSVLNMNRSSVAPYGLQSVGFPIQNP